MEENKEHIRRSLLDLKVYNEDGKPGNLKDGKPANQENLITSVLYLDEDYSDKTADPSLLSNTNNNKSSLYEVLKEVGVVEGEAFGQNDDKKSNCQ